MCGAERRSIEFQRVPLDDTIYTSVGLETRRLFPSAVAYFVPGSNNEEANNLLGLIASEITGQGLDDDTPGVETDSIITRYLDLLNEEGAELLEAWNARYQRKEK